MTDYVKSTNFTSKDSLATGNPLKIVKGTEFDTEFNNIATAVATKADLADPTFTGTVSAPTPALSAAGTTVATVAAIQALYPIGSVYINASSYTNPATLFGFGTWVAFGTGRVMVGLDGLDPIFDNLGDIGGNKDATVVSHSHTGTTGGQSNDHTHNITFDNRGDAFGGSPAMSIAYGSSAKTTTGVSADHSHNFTTSTAGSSATNANLQPYITVMMWKRTA